MAQLYIPNSVALRNFDSLYTNNDFDFSDDKAVNLSFHPNYVALHPVALAFYAAIGDIIKEKQYTLSGEINQEIRSIPYLQRMGLFKALGAKNIIHTQEHEETGRFISLRKIRNGKELEEFINTIDPILHTNRENSRVIKHVFSEILRNILEHSDATLGGNVCATYNKNKKKISIGISDAGKGLFTSIARNHKITTNKDAIIKALTPGISGNTSRLGGNEENAGAGLFFTKCIAQSTKNHFLIYSGSSYFKLKLTPSNKQMVFQSNPLDDYCTIKENLPFFRGTLVGIDINIEDNDAFNNLITDIGNAYTLGVKKSHKDYSKQIKFT